MSDCCHMDGETMIVLCEVTGDKCLYEGDASTCPIWKEDRADAAALRREDREYEAAVDEEAERRG